MTAGNVFLAACPARLAVEIIADKWAVVVLYGLAGPPRRHGELARLIGGISSKVLTHNHDAGSLGRGQRRRHP